MVAIDGVGFARWNDQCWIATKRNIPEYSWTVELANGPWLCPTEIEHHEGDVPVSLLLLV